MPIHQSPRSGSGSVLARLLSGARLLLYYWGMAVHGACRVEGAIIRCTELEDGIRSIAWALGEAIGNVKLYSPGGDQVG
jgi:hypothetical protein